MSGVNIEYKGESIATIPNTGSKTIKTQGKYCEGDILVEYEAPPTPTLITKQITANGTYTAADDNADGYSEVTVNVPVPTPVEEKAVNFYDYDGTVLYAYTAQEALALTALPEAPTHEGLTFQGWNRTLAQLQAYVTDYGVGNIGATYITDDGATRLYLEVGQDVSLDYTLYCRIANGTLTVEVDGVELGSATGTSTGYINYTIPFTLPNRGNVRVDLKFTGTSGFRIGQGDLRTRIFGWNSIQNNTLIKVEFGNFITSISQNAFNGCNTLNSIVIPNGVTEIGNDAFGYCSSLNFVVIPNSLTVIGSTPFGNSSLKNIIIPNSITSIGNSVFQNCCIDSIVLPDSITGFEIYSFRNCWSLSSITIPNSITNIGNGALSEIQNLNRIIIPNSITNIGGGVFSSCSLLFVLDLSQYTDPNNLPTFANSNFLSGTPTDQIIYVANQEMLTAFSNAPNISVYADRMVIKA